MRKSCDPALDTVLASKFVFSHQNMNPTIIIPSIFAKVLAQDIFFHPIDFEVSKWLTIPETNRWERVLGSQIVLEECFLCALRARTSPELRDPVNIHPFIQKLKIRHQGCVF